ncbi:hypothetical protein BH23CHL2_BH23CHL2_28330 [soil metagenome]
MRCPAEWYQLHTAIVAAFPTLRPAQQRGLSWWVYGTLLAHSACQTAVLTVLLRLGSYHAWRQYLREWLYDGADRAAACQPTLDVSRCFAPLLGWIVRWWQSEQLALAVDVTQQGTRVAVIVVSVLYRGCAIPVAWHVVPARARAPWMSHLVRLWRLLAPAVPAHWTVLVLADRGLWSPRLWKRCRDLGWHPVLRLRGDVTFAPAGQTRLPARRLIPGPGHAWVGKGMAFKHRQVRRAGTLLVVWAPEAAAPWMILTDLAPREVGLSWYGLRMWVELGFRALKSLGWQWQRTRRSDPARIARHWLVLAVATLWTLAYGTRVEDAQHLGRDPARLTLPPTLSQAIERQLSVVRQGWSWLSYHLARGRLWTRLWLTPEPWPDTLANLTIHYHDSS